jgi:hypothetical protein
VVVNPELLAGSAEMQRLRPQCAFFGDYSSPWVFMISRLLNETYEFSKNLNYLAAVM